MCVFAGVGRPIRRHTHLAHVPGSLPSPLSVIVSQVPTRLPVHLQSVDVDALLIAVNILVRELFAVCAEAIPLVTRRGEVPLADQPP